LRRKQVLNIGQQNQLRMREKKLFNSGIRFIGIYIFLIWFPGEIAGQVADSSKRENIPGSVQSPLYMMTYDHGGLVLWGTDHFAKYLRSATDWLDNYPGFKIGLDNEAYTYDFLKQNDTILLNELRGNLKRYSGRFGIGTCTYGQPLSQFINEESNIRQIGYALETDYSVFHYRPLVYLMSEHAMHSQLPQILNGFGFKGAIMRTHFMMYGYNPTYNSSIGWWIGRDGSRIPAIPTYKGEGNGFGWVTEDNMILTRYPGPECKESFEPFRDKFSGIKPLLATRVDDSGLRQEGLVKEYEGKKDYKWILADEIFPEFPAPSDEFKTLPDDFHVRMPWGYCGNEIWNMSRQAEVKVLTAERLAAMETMRGGENYEPYLHKSWKNLLVGQHHDIQICGILSDSRRFLPASIILSDSIINSSMSYISSGMQGGKLAQITVFNPLSWTRNDWTTFEILIPSGIKTIIVQRDDQQVPFEILSSVKLSDNKTTRMLVALKVEIPALTFQSYSVSEAKKIAQNKKTIEFEKDSLRIVTPFWLVKLDKRGGISSLTNRMTGKAMLTNHRSGYFEGVIGGQPFESTGKWEADSISLNNHQVTLYEVGSIGPIPYRLEMKLNDASPRIDFKAEFHFNNEMIGRVSENKREIASAFLHEEKLRFKIFPLLGPGTTGIRDLPFTIAETDNRYVEGNYWTALADGHSGMAFFNRGNMGSVHEDDGSFSMPLAYSMFYVWKTVILNGDFTYEFAVYPFEGKWINANIHNEAINYNYPLILRSSKKGDGKLGSRYQPFEMESKNVILSALYTSGGKPFMRFYESQGSKDSLKLIKHSGSVRYTEVNLLEKEEGIVNSPLIFLPWQIRTIKVDDTVSK
jgi:alpha-mannosidase